MQTSNSCICQENILIRRSEIMVEHDTWEERLLSAVHLLFMIKKNNRLSSNHAMFTGLYDYGPHGIRLNECNEYARTSYDWNLCVSTGSRFLISALPAKIPSRYTHRLCTSIHTSNRALILFSLSSQPLASSSNTYNHMLRNDHQTPKKESVKQCVVTTS